MNLKANLATLLLAWPVMAVAQEQAQPPAVTAVELATQDVAPQFRYSGRIESPVSVDLRARVAGFLQEIRFDEGATVEEGDLLFVIEREHYEAEVAKVEADILAARGVLQLADLEVSRQTRLVATQAAAQARLDIANAEKARAQGELNREEAELILAQLNLSYTEVKAPVTGRISRTPFDIGDVVGPEDDPLATIVSMDPMYVEFPIAMSELLTLRERARGSGETRDDVALHIELADGSLYDQDGTISFVDVRVQTGTDTVDIRGEIPNPDWDLVSGAAVTVVVDIGEPQPEILVPQSAVLFDQGGRYVLTIDENNAAQITRITVTDSIGSFFILKDGLAEGDRLIIEGLQKARPGQPVEPTMTDMPQYSQAAT